MARKPKALAKPPGKALGSTKPKELNPNELRMRYVEGKTEAMEAVQP